MNEERSITPTRVLVGDFEIIARVGGFALSGIASVTERYRSLGTITLRSQTLAWDVAELLSLAFSDGVSNGTVSFRLGDLGYAEVTGGKDGLCELFRWNGKRQKQEEKPFLITQSCGELEDGLLKFLRDQNGD